MTFSKLAEQTLRKHGAPLTPLQIWNKAVEYGFDKLLPESERKTPENTLKTQLDREVEKGEKSIFERYNTTPATYGLKGEMETSQLPDGIAEKVEEILRADGGKLSAQEILSKLEASENRSEFVAQGADGGTKHD